MLVINAWTDIPSRSGSTVEIHCFVSLERLPLVQITHGLTVPVGQMEKERRFFGGGAGSFQSDELRVGEAAIVTCHPKRNNRVDVRIVKAAKGDPFGPTLPNEDMCNEATWEKGRPGDGRKGPQSAEWSHSPA